jgi:hypothetical protein
MVQNNPHTVPFDSNASVDFKQMPQMIHTYEILASQNPSLFSTRSQKVLLKRKGNVVKRDFGIATHLRCEEQGFLNSELYCDNALFGSLTSSFAGVNTTNCVRFILLWDMTPNT